MTTLVTLRTYPTPGYPTADELRERPELLAAPPRRWGRRGALSLVGLALGAGPACGSTTHAAPTDRPTEVASASHDAEEGGADGGSRDTREDDREARPSSLEDSSSGDAGSVPSTGQGQALVFEVGDGRGAVGCVAVAPPVFLTEDEAWEVLRDELSRAGLSLLRGGPTLPAIRTPVYEMCGGQVGMSQPVGLELDGGDAGRHVAVEFLSVDDHETYWDQRSICSVQSYHFLEAARAIAQELGQPQNLLVGIFYDPATSVCYGGSCPSHIRGEPTEEAARAKSLGDLRGQVQQFVRFLRSTGVI